MLLVFTPELNVTRVFSNLRINKMKCPHCGSLKTRCFQAMSPTFWNKQYWQCQCADCGLASPRQATEADARKIFLDIIVHYPRKDESG